MPLSLSRRTSAIHSLFAGSAPAETVLGLPAYGTVRPAAIARAGERGDLRLQRRDRGLELGDPVVEVVEVDLVLRRVTEDAHGDNLVASGGSAAPAQPSSLPKQRLSGSSL